MKNLVKLPLFVLFGSSSISCFGQNLVMQHNSQEQVLYRGFNNSLAVSLGEIPFNELFFECVDCQVLPEKEGSIIIRTGTGKNPELIVSCKYDPDLGAKQSFIVQNLPAPQIFLGYKESGAIVTMNDLQQKISVGYDACVSFRTENKLVSWELSMDGTTILGQSDVLSSAAIDLLSSRDASTFTLSVLAENNMDGIQRKLIGIFVLEKTN